MIKHKLPYTKDKVDRISKLPDEMLASIISRLEIKEAVATSILSKSWRYIYASMPVLRFSCLAMFGKDDHKYVECYRDKFIKVVDHILMLYSGVEIVSLHMELCFVTEYISEFEQWMRAIVAMGIEELRLSFPSLHAHGYHITKCEYNFPLEMISKSSLERLHLSSCNLVVSPKCQFISLKTLCLSRVVLHNGDSQRILSSCINLEKLRLDWCKLPSKLSINSPEQLKFLATKCCVGLEVIVISAANLVTLEFSSDHLVRLVLPFVPKLKVFNLSLHGKSTAPYVFGELAEDLKHLEYFSFQSCVDKVEYIDAGRNMFRNLRELHLIIWYTLEFNLLNVTPILEACALLQKFQLAAYDQGLYQRSSFRRQLFDTVLRTLKLKPRYDEEDRVWGRCICHENLKEVTLGGFHGTRNEIEFALFVLRSAVVLDRMVISRSFTYFTGDGKYSHHNGNSFGEQVRDMFYEELRGQAVSSTAKLIIDCPVSML